MDEPGEDDEGEGVEGHGWKKAQLECKSRSACGCGWSVQYLFKR